MRLHQKFAPFVISLASLALAGVSSMALAAEPAAGDKPLARMEVVDTPISPYAVPSTSSVMGTETPLLDTPYSVQSIPRQVIDDQAAQSLADVMLNVPGVALSLGEGNRDQFSLRGVSTKSDFFIDGLRDDSERYRPLYNVERVDVLQGPAALVFGRGGAGGVINLVTKHATQEDIRHFGMEAGSWEHFAGEVDINTPLSESIAFRINAMGESSGSFRDHANIHRYGINPTLHLNLGTDTDIDLGFTYEHDSRFIERGIPDFDGRPVHVARSTVFAAPQNHYVSRYLRGNFDIEHRFSDTFKIRNSFVVSDNRRSYLNLYPGSAADANGLFSLSAYDHPNDRLTYQDRLELVGKLATGSIEHEILAGAEYSWQRDNDLELLPANANGAKTVLDALGNKVFASITDPASVPGMPPMGFVDRDNRVVGKNIGLFLQDQISFASWLKAVVGVRWDSFKVDAAFHELGQSLSRTDRKWSPRAGLIIKPVPNDSLYVSFSQTYTPSGSNLSLDWKSPDNTLPVKAQNLEVGNKLSLLDGNLALTAALFQLDLTNMKANDPSGSGDVINTGKQRNRGVELSVEGAITPLWQVYAGYTYIDARIRAPIQGAPVGARVGLVPSSQYSLWSTYAITPDFGFGVGVRGTTKQYTSFSNAVVLPGYVTGDMMFYYQKDRYRFQVKVNNIVDRTYFATASGDHQIMFGAPMSVIGSFGVDF